MYQVYLLKHLLRVVPVITNIIKHRLHVWQIVTSRRGGWCHELNGGFSWLLRELGFSVRVVSAQYWQVQYSTVQYSTAQYWQTDKREYCKLFDHMALIVDLGGQNYLVDVGFGNISQPSEPIRWNINFFLPPVTCDLVDF